MEKDQLTYISFSFFFCSSNNFYNILLDTKFRKQKCVQMSRTVYKTKYKTWEKILKKGGVASNIKDQYLLIFWVNYLALCHASANFQIFFWRQAFSIFDRSTAISAFLEVGWTESGWSSRWFSSTYGIYTFIVTVLS